MSFLFAQVAPVVGAELERENNVSQVKSQGVLQHVREKFDGMLSKRNRFLVCLLAICLAGGAIYYHRPTSAGVAAEVSLSPVIAKGGGSIADLPNKAAAQADGFAAKPSIWPTSGEITSPFGWRTSPWGEGRELHPGLDIANSMGTPVVATAEGVVVQSGPAGGYGNVVQIDHGNGIETIYGHNSRLAAHVGDLVKKGQIIAYMGSTGRSTGPHAHYEVRVNGVPVDPMPYLVQY